MGSRSAGSGSGPAHDSIRKEVLVKLVVGRDDDEPPSKRARKKAGPAPQRVQGTATKLGPLTTVKLKKCDDHKDGCRGCDGCVFETDEASWYLQCASRDMMP